MHFNVTLPRHMHDEYEPGTVEVVYDGSVVAEEKLPHYSDLARMVGYIKGIVLRWCHICDQKWHNTPVIIIGGGVAPAMADMGGHFKFRYSPFRIENGQVAAPPDTVHGTV